MWRCLLYSSVLVFAVGCDAGPKLAPVSGKVTLDGKPLAGARVSFYPEGGSQSSTMAPLSSGKTNENGEYSLQTVLKQQTGAVVGKHRVSVALLAVENIDEGDAPAKVIKRGPATTLKDKIPLKYQGEKSELTIDVPSGGTNKADFPLKSR